MRSWTVMLVVVILAVSTTSWAQDSRSDGGGSTNEESILEVGLRSAAALTLQPNATTQRRRRGGRIGAGVGLVSAGVLIWALKGWYLDDDLVMVEKDTRRNIEIGINLGAVALIAGGALAIWTADVSSPLPSQGKKGWGLRPVRTRGGVVPGFSW